MHFPRSDRAVPSVPSTGGLNSRWTAIGPTPLSPAIKTNGPLSNSLQVRVPKGPSSWS